MLKAASSSSPTLDVDKPVQEQMTSESEEPFSEQHTEDVDNELSFEEEWVTRILPSCLLFICVKFYFF